MDVPISLIHFWHIVLKGPEWTIQARIKIHNKPITDLIFGTFTNNKFGSNSDLFSIGLDRKICRIANNALSLRKNVDKNSDPLVISYFQGQAHHMFFTNPESTNLCENIGWRYINNHSDAQRLGIYFS